LEGNEDYMFVLLNGVSNSLEVNFYFEFWDEIHYEILARRGSYDVKNVKVGQTIMEDDRDDLESKSDGFLCNT
jgi:hypothetical protein